MRASLRVVGWLAVAALLVASLLLATRDGTDRAAPDDAPVTPRTPAAVGPTPPAVAPIGAARNGSIEHRRDRIAVLPPSLRGSEPDGALAIDHDGRLRVDIGLRRWFDWHRSAIGEFDQATIRQRIAAGLDEQLPAGPAARGLALYDDYCAYLAASEQAPVPADPLAQLDAMRELRIDWLGREVAEAFFADEELTLETRLLRRQIAQDVALTEAERERRLAAFDAGLPGELQPPPAQQQFEQATLLDQLHRTEHVDGRQRFAERSALFGDEAALRLAARDRAERQWQDRLAEYRAFSSLLADDPRLDAGQREQTLQQWLQSVGPAERRRLQALAAEPEAGS